MKFHVLTLGIAASVIALGLTGIAVAAPAGNAPAVTHWDIAQENLVREFSQGLGVDFPGANPVVLAAQSDSAAAGASAERRSHEHRTKKTRHSH
jgi:hypothetical protein